MDHFSTSRTECQPPQEMALLSPLAVHGSLALGIGSGTIDMPPGAAPYILSKARHTCFILDLPPELLAIIFTYTFYIQRHDKKFASITLKDISHVCRYWREIILDLPTLWANAIEYTRDPRRWAFELLQRSKEVPLRVDVALWPREIGETFWAICHPRTRKAIDNAALASDRPHRIRDFTVSAPFSIMEIFTEMMREPMPALECLSLATFDLPRMFPLPPNLFGRTTSPLRHLRLINFSVPWTSPLFQNNLTVLQFSRAANPSDVKLTPLLDILQNLPMLQKLSLGYFFTDEQLENTPRQYTAQLPSLRYLELAFEQTQHIQFIHHLIFPPNITFQLLSRIKPGEDISDVTSTVLSKLIPTQNSNRPKVLRAMSLRGCCRKYTFSGWTKLQAGIAFPPKVNIVLHFESDVPQTTSQVSKQMLSLCEQFPTEKLANLLVEFAEPINISTPTWQATLKHMKSLSLVKLGGLPRGFLRAIDPEYLSQEDHPAELVLPKLRCLHIRDTDFANCLLGLQPKTSTLLTKCVANRHGRGLLLKLLKISRCLNLSVGDGTVLESKVAAFEWDRLEDADHSETI